jgi:hypothetical protein
VRAPVADIVARLDAAGAPQQQVAVAASTDRHPELVSGSPAERSEASMEAAILPEILKRVQDNGVAVPAAGEAP